MDKIILKNMRFYAYHGVLQEEQEKGQYFHIDAEMLYDLKEAGRTDELEDTVNYAEIYNIIKDITENNKFRLIECLGERISREILSRYDRITEVTIRVRKPDVPINGELDWAEVELRRGRNG